MKTREKLNLMKEVEAHNTRRIKEFTYTNKKHWKVDYTTLKDGVQEEGSFVIVALSINEAVVNAQALLVRVSVDYGWNNIVIWKIGIMEEDVF
jgi:hypothetical protein